jgi:hypothetical protein
MTLQTKYKGSEADEDEDPGSKSKKRARSKSHQKSKSSSKERLENDAEEEELATETVQDTGPDLKWTPVDISAMYPYGYPGSSPMNALGGWHMQHQAGFPSTKPVRANKPSKSPAKTPQRRFGRSSTTTNQDDLGDEEEDNEEDGVHSSDDIEEEVTPKSKRRKTTQTASSSGDHLTEYPQDHIWTQMAQFSTGPSGLQPPNMGSVPFGAVPTSMPPWWQQGMGSGWSQPPQMHQAVQGPNNATLWAYYYYGYAMGQYDALKLSHFKKHSE